MLLLCACSNQDSDDAKVDGNYSYADVESGAYPDYGYVETPSGDQFSEITDNPFVSAKENNVSTFSVDADGAAYGIMRKYTSNGWSINKSSARIEEYLNYFPYNYAEPTDGNNVAINYEIGECPWNKEHRLLRLGIKGKTLTADETPLANFVFLIDVSGSMDESDKLGLLKTSLIKMLDYMNPNDKISIVTYSGEVRLVLESTKVSEAATITKAIKSLESGGCTNGGDALKMAYEQAMNNYSKDKNNRIILGTDGDFNFGITGTDDLTKLVESYAEKGIYLTACGFGSGNLNDAMMESISNSGNGTYEYIDCEDEMMKVFVHERGKFTSVANDSKCQVTFDSTCVKSYRLIGYENRMLSAEDFENDKKDAGEIGSGQTITALYEVELTDAAKLRSDIFQIAKFDFRYKKSLMDESIPLSLDINNVSNNGQPSEDFTFQAGVAAFGMTVRDSEYKGTSSLDMAKELIGSSLTYDPHGYRAQFLNIIGKVIISDDNDYYYMY